MGGRRLCLVTGYFELGPGTLRLAAGSIVPGGLPYVAAARSVWRLTDLEARFRSPDRGFDWSLAGALVSGLSAAAGSHVHSRRKKRHLLRQGLGALVEKAAYSCAAGGTNRSDGGFAMWMSTEANRDSSLVPRGARVSRRAETWYR